MPATWPTTITARGCYDSSLHASKFTCPPTTTGNSSLFPAALSAFKHVVVDQNSTTGSTTFAICCNTSKCNDIDSLLSGTTAKKPSQDIDDGVSATVTNYFAEGPVVNPPKGKMAFVDMVMVGIVGFFGFGMGLIVDFAATNRFMFKEV